MIEAAEVAQIAVVVGGGNVLRGVYAVDPMVEPDAVRFERPTFDVGTLIS